MRPFATLLVACLALVTNIQAATLKGAVQFVGQFDASVIAPSSKVLLDHGAQSALVRRDGSFEMHNVPDGQHVLSSSIPSYILQPLYITVSSQPGAAMDTPAPAQIHIQPFVPGREPLPTSSTSMPHPIQLTLLGKEDYFTRPQGLNLFGMLRNPMVLMMLVSGVLMYGMPKLIASVEQDPEMKKEMAATRKKMSGYQNMDLTKSLSSMLAGEQDDAVVPPAGKASASGQAVSGTAGSATAPSLKKRGRK